MYNIDDELYNEFSYICESCGYDRGVLNHSQYNTVCPECGGRYIVTPIIRKEEEIE